MTESFIFTKEQLPASASVDNRNQTSTREYQNKGAGIFFRFEGRTIQMFSIHSPVGDYMRRNRAQRDRFLNVARLARHVNLARPVESGSHLLFRRTSLLLRICEQVGWTVIAKFRVKQSNEVRHDPGEVRKGKGGCRGSQETETPVVSTSCREEYVFGFRKGG